MKPLNTRRSVVAAGLCCAALLAPATPASAGVTVYRNSGASDPSLAAYTKDRDVTRTNLYSSISWLASYETNRVARAGAHPANSYAWYSGYYVDSSSGYACATYGGPSVGAMVENIHSVPVKTAAIAKWGSDYGC